jgi:hypothetical protein
MCSREKVETYDFLLVTTYVPVLWLCTRATITVLLVHWLVFFLEVPWHAVAMVLGRPAPAALRARRRARPGTGLGGTL